MKGFSKALILTVFVFCFGALLVPGSSLNASAASKKGLVEKKSGNYVYYKNGTKLKKTWKKVSVDGKKYWFYFKANGNACKGSLTREGLEKPLVKKIGGTRYAFDSKGHALTGVQYFNGKFYYFSKSHGKYDSAKTKKLRNACQYGEKTNLPSLLQKYGMKPKKKINQGASCMGSGNDWLYVYDGFSVSLRKEPDGTWIFYYVEQTR